MEVNSVTPKQKTRKLAPSLAILLVLLVVLTLIGVGLVLAGPAYAAQPAF